MTVHHTTVHIHFRLLQSHQFGNAQAGGVHQLQHRPISYAVFCLKKRRGKQTIDFLLGEKLWQLVKLVWSIEVLSGMKLDVSIKHEKLKETTSGTHRSRD